MSKRLPCILGRDTAKDTLLGSACNQVILLEVLIPWCRANRQTLPHHNLLAQRCQNFTLEGAALFLPPPTEKDQILGQAKQVPWIPPQCPSQWTRQRDGRPEELPLD